MDNTAPTCWSDAPKKFTPPTPIKISQAGGHSSLSAQLQQKNCRSSISPPPVPAPPTSVIMQGGRHLAACAALHQHALEVDVCPGTMTSCLIPPTAGIAGAPISLGYNLSQCLPLLQGSGTWLRVLPSTSITWMPAPAPWQLFQVPPTAGPAGEGHLAARAALHQDGLDGERLPRHHDARLAVAHGAHHRRAVEVPAHAVAHEAGHHRKALPLAQLVDHLVAQIPPSCYASARIAGGGQQTSKHIWCKVSGSLAVESPLLHFCLASWLVGAVIAAARRQNGSLHTPRAPHSTKEGPAPLAGPLKTSTTLALVADNIGCSAMNVSHPLGFAATTALLRLKPW